MNKEDEYINKAISNLLNRKIKKLVINTDGFMEELKK